MRVAGAVAPDSAQSVLTEAGFRVGEITVGGTFNLVVACRCLRWGGRCRALWRVSMKMFSRIW
jgi:hypothetical protein